MKNGYCFERIDLDIINIEEFNSFFNKTVFTTKSWIEFVIEDSKAVLYMLRITKGDKLVGYFTSLIVKKNGIKIVGSPFPGWSTPFMGFDIYDNYSRIEILQELVPFVMEDTKCAYLQINDRNFVYEELKSFKNQYYTIIGECETLELGIKGDDEVQYKKMKTDCRNFIKQFERRGAIIERAEPNDDFAEEYYEQLLDVFAKQNLVPTYTIDKVKCLLNHLAKSDSIYCLRVKDPEGNSIATSIFLGFNKKMFFWGGASLRECQHYRPNEYMIYTAMHYWREKGCTEFDMVGNRAYKKKFGSWEVSYPCIIVSKYKILVQLKNLVAKLYYLSGTVLWKLHLKR